MIGPEGTMLIHVGDSRTEEVDLRLAITLSAIAGAINAAGFHAVGFFSANMTGNISSLSDLIALGNWAMAATLAAVVFAFILGALASGLLIQIGRARDIRGIYAYSILLEGTLLALLGTADLMLDIAHSGPLLIIGLSFLMGLQNAATTLITNARVRTTHVSGMATDVGIELAAMLRSRDPAGRRAIGNLLRLHGSTLVAFFVGGVLGVLLYLVIGSIMLLLLAAALCALALPYVRRGTSSG
jgi:uncharacterized membrane protein YoaK (UPF0700 family)